jgi:hypothetical protein
MLDLWPCADAWELIQSNGPVLPCPNYDLTFVIFFILLAAAIAAGIITYFELRARFTNLRYTIEWAIYAIEKYLSKYECVQF